MITPFDASMWQTGMPQGTKDWVFISPNLSFQITKLHQFSNCVRSRPKKMKDDSFPDKPSFHIAGAINRENDSCQKWPPPREFV
jgi:hypothetical protein